MRSKEFAFCNKILYTHHPYLSDHQNVQLSTVSYKKKTHTQTKFPKNCYVGNMLHSVYSVKQSTQEL